MDARTRYWLLPTPIAELLLVDRGAGLAGLYLPPHRWAPEVGSGWLRDHGPFADAVDQLGAYLAGERRAFDLPLDLRGTPFQRRVWEALLAIPYGQTSTYGALAARLGVPSASRAVGAANGRNPVSIVVPCHRVVGAGGDLTGYGGGVERKRALLALEARVAGRDARLFDAT